MREPQETEITPAEELESAAVAPAGIILKISIKTNAVDIILNNFFFMKIPFP